ncbi:hypothetical protein KQX54_006242 [Cotesia glomerata]|uniref:Uncharacterized protein n=1 Tax=Cotesia glomerata TaxID=32391 RepID=A0AAV7J0Z2_COTGL|nr:hypothetical protein KQX54_006242 [Cotesia glomerata]
MAMSRKRPYEEGETSGPNKREPRILQSWEKFDFLLATYYKLNDSRSKSIVVGLKLNSDNFKFEPCSVIVDEKSCGIVCKGNQWLQFTAAVKQQSRKFYLSEGDYKKQPDDSTSLNGYIFKFSTLGAIYVRKVIMKQNTVQNIYEFEELVNARLQYLKKFCEPCDVYIKQLLAPVTEILPKIQTNFGSIELSEEMMHKFVVAGLKNNNVTEKIRKQLEEKEGEFTWFNDAYVDLVIYC